MDQGAGEDSSVDLGHNLLEVVRGRVGDAHGLHGRVEAARGIHLCRIEWEKLVRIGQENLLLIEKENLVRIE